MPGFEQLPPWVQTAITILAGSVIAVLGWLRKAPTSDAPVATARTHSVEEHVKIRGAAIIDSDVMTELTSYVKVIAEASVKGCAHMKTISDTMVENAERQERLDEMRQKEEMDKLRRENDEFRRLMQTR